MAIKAINGEVYYHCIHGAACRSYIAHLMYLRHDDDTLCMGILTGTDTIVMVNEDCHDCYDRKKSMLQDQIILAKEQYEDECDAAQREYERARAKAEHELERVRVSATRELDEVIRNLNNEIIKLEQTRRIPLLKQSPLKKRRRNPVHIAKLETEALLK